MRDKALIYSIVRCRLLLYVMSYEDDWLGFFVPAWPLGVCEIVFFGVYSTRVLARS